MPFTATASGCAFFIVFLMQGTKYVVFVDMFYVIIFAVNCGCMKMNDAFITDLFMYDSADMRNQKKVTHQI